MMRKLLNLLKSFNEIFENVFNKISNILRIKIITIPFKQLIKNIAMLF